MVRAFKLHPGKHPSYIIEAGAVETHNARQMPWFVKGAPDRHYAICPYCDNPIQLKALYNRSDNSPLPYGAHVGKDIAGFRYNEGTQNNCPYIAPNTGHGGSEKRPLDDIAEQLIETAISEFDRIVLILRDDYGFRFSNAFAGRLLKRWLASEGYLYPRAHLRNLPWMIAYFGESENLFGQPVGANADLAAAIAEKVPNARLDHYGRLHEKAGYLLLRIQALNHQSRIEDDDLIETLDLRVLDFSHTRFADNAPEVFAITIEFHPARFEALIHTDPDRAKRDDGLLELALEVRKRVGFVGEK